MNTVSYVVEYEYAAMGLITVLVLIFCARRKYPGMSNRIYAGMLIWTFFSSLTHGQAPPYSTVTSCFSCRTAACTASASAYCRAVSAISAPRP